MVSLKLTIGSIIVWLLTITPVMAGISADTTRIIFHATDTAKGKGVGLSSSSNSTTPYLVKAQVTHNVQGETESVPFITVPTLFRLEPDSSNQVRIIKTSDELPQDRESLFYFRGIAMPAGSDGSASPQPLMSGTLQVATATVIKLFYRPAGLPISQPQAMSKLQFSAERQGLKATNPTPYYITLNRLSVNHTPVTLKIEEGSSMIAPYSSAWYPGAAHQGAVEWIAINDYGGTETFHGKVQ